MKVLWLCNVMPGTIEERILGKDTGNGYWMDNVLLGLRKEGLQMKVLFPSVQAYSGEIDHTCSYATFFPGIPHLCSSELEEYFCEVVSTFAPDMVHIWGTEYGHTLAMVNTCEKIGYIDRVIINIQGLCSVYSRHYSEGVPYSVQKICTLRDFIRKDSICRQKKRFVLQGENEVRALSKVKHVIGRTDWDKACVKAINPDVQYHFCNETLRQCFYDGTWDYDECKKHRIFSSSCAYPVKGFHYLLEAFSQVLKMFPDATLAVPGEDPFETEGIHQRSYPRYICSLMKKYGLKEKVEFLGRLTAEEMKQSFLKANVFVLPSTIENSPNSLGEAMLLGVPCVSSDVGGVSSLLSHQKEGFVYQSTAPYMLAYYIEEVFGMEERARELGRKAKERAQKTHDSRKNLQTLLEIYYSVIEMAK